MTPTAPVSPKDGGGGRRNWCFLWRGRQGGKRMQNGTHAAWLLRCGSISLTLFSQGTRSTSADPGSIQDAQRAIAFGSTFLGRERVSCGTVQGAIWLRGELLSGKAAHLRRFGPRRGTVGHQSRSLASRGGKRRGFGGSKFGGAHGSRMEAMSQFQAQIPHPLANHLPGFLPTGSMRAPAIWVLLLVFVGEDCLKSTTVQVEGHDISSGEGALWQGGVKQLVDDVVACHADWTCRGGSGMRCDDHACSRSCRCEGDIRTIEEGAAGTCFRMGRLAVRRPAKTGLHRLQIEQMIIPPSHDPGQESKVGNHGSVAILSIQAHHRLREGKVMGLQIRTDDRDGAPELATVIAIACPRKR